MMTCDSVAFWTWEDSRLAANGTPGHRFSESCHHDTPVETVLGVQMGKISAYSQIPTEEGS